MDTVVCHIFVTFVGLFNIYGRSENATVGLNQFSRFFIDMKALLREKVYVVNVLGIFFYPCGLFNSIFLSYAVKG